MSTAERAPNARNRSSWAGIATVPVDVVLAVFILPAVLVAMGWRRLTAPRRPQGRGAILHLSSSASTRDVVRKFGSLDFLFEYDGSATQELFARVVLCWYPSQEDQDRTYPQGWRILERRKFLGVFPICGLVLTWILLARIATLEDVRLIRAWNPYIPGITAWLLSRAFRVPFCISIHADDEQRYRLDGARGAFTVFGSRPLARWLQRFVLERAAAIMPIRDSLAESMIRSGADRSRVRVIPHGIRMDAFRRRDSSDIRQRLGCAPGIPVVSFAGRLSRENYVNEMLEAAVRLLDRRTDVVFVFAGDGPERESLVRAIASSDVPDRSILLPGFLAHDDVISLRRQSLVSLCLMGGFSLIEACAAGRPVIAYDVEWHRELVRTGETGILLQEHDVAGVADAIEHLLNHPTAADRLGKRAQALAFERHDIEVTALVKRDAYRFALQAGGHVA